MNFHLNAWVLFFLTTSLAHADQTPIKAAVQKQKYDPKKEAIQFFIAHKNEEMEIHIKNEPSETLWQNIHKNRFFRIGITFLVSCLCDSAANYVSDSYNFGYQPYIHINSRDAARIGLEGVSRIALLSFLDGYRDENNNFKLHCDKETFADGVSASFRYALIKHLVAHNTDRVLQERFPEIGGHFYIKNGICFATGLAYDEAYVSLKRRYMQSR